MPVSSYTLFLKGILFQVSHILFFFAFISGIIAFFLYFCLETSKNKRPADVKIVKKFIFITIILFGISMIIPSITMLI